MKKIAFIQYTLNGGGAEKVLITLLNNLDYGKYDVTLYLIFKEGVYLNKVNNNVKVKSIYDSVKFKNRILRSVYYRITNFLFYKYPKVLYRLIIGNNNDIEIAFLEGETTKFLSNSTNVKSRKIAWIHSDLKKHRVLSSIEEFNAYDSVDKIICVSEDAKMNFNELYPSLAIKTQTIYNIIDRDEVKEKSISNTLKFDTSKINVISVGRLTKAKGFDLLLKAHNELIAEEIDYTLTILGEGIERKQLEDYIKENNLNKSVQLIGFKDNPYPYIEQADIMVMSSRYEGFSLVLAESIILNKPIIATRCTGPVEILDNGKYGVIVDCEDYLALKNKMKEMILDSSVRKKYSNLAKEREVMFKSKEVIKQINDLLN